MCAINPTHQLHFRVSIYTSHDVDAESFRTNVAQRMLEVEQTLNKDGRIRAHVSLFDPTDLLLGYESVADFVRDFGEAEVLRRAQAFLDFRP